jgi:Predicted AAA-ATPase/PD-(D/E)XK nuclease superfamily
MAAMRQIFCLKQPSIAYLCELYQASRRHIFFMTNKSTPVGTSNFKKIIEENKYYVDKSMLIRHVLRGQDVILLCRPRRFGKTLNLMMLQRFFTHAEDNAHLFKGLKISEDAESMAHLGKYPVVFFSLKDAKMTTLTEMNKQLRRILIEPWKEHRYLAQNPLTADDFKETYENIVKADSDMSELAWSFRTLTKLLYQHHGEPVVVLIDEYDTPVHIAWLNGFYDEFIAFMKSLLSAMLKDNNAVKKAVLTGILRVSKESMFSDLNNFISSSVLDDDVFSDMFGFTDAEVLDMLRAYDMNGREMNDLQDWYDGYRFGGKRIYNPWSILNYVFSLRHEFKSYWVNTSQDSLLRRLFFDHATGIRPHMESLINGEKIPVRLNEFLVFRDLNNDPGAVWTLLVLAGYLKIENFRDKNHYDVSIPNREIRDAYTEAIYDWLKIDMGVTTRQRMLDALAAGRVQEFERLLSGFVVNVFSYFDTAGGETQPGENFYHAFFLGLFSGLEYEYILRSNREDGYGRYDICLMPRDKSRRAIIIEVKATTKKRESLTSALQLAVKQLRQNQYESGLREAGIQQVLRLAIAVQYKKVKVAVA